MLPDARMRTHGESPKTPRKRRSSDAGSGGYSLRSVLQHLHAALLYREANLAGEEQLEPRAGYLVPPPR